MNMDRDFNLICYPIEGTLTEGNLPETVNNLLKAVQHQRETTEILALENQEIKRERRKQVQEYNDLRNIIGYCNFNVPDDYDEACRLLSMAIKFQMKQLIKSCTEVLKKTISISNCVNLLQLAGKESLEDLHEIANSFILDNFVNLPEQDLRSLALEEIFPIFLSDNLRVHKEEDIFDALVRWVKGDSKERRNNVPVLMSVVRLPLCESKLLHMLKDNYLLWDSDEVQELLDKAIVLVESGSEELAKTREQIRRCK